MLKHKFEKSFAQLQQLHELLSRQHLDNKTALKELQDSLVYHEIKQPRNVLFIFMRTYLNGVRNQLSHTPSPKHNGWHTTWEHLGFWLPPKVTKREWIPIVGELKRSLSKSKKLSRGWLSKTNLVCAFTWNTISSFLPVFIRAHLHPLIGCLPPILQKLWFGDINIPQNQD